MTETILLTLIWAIAIIIAMITIAACFLFTTLREQNSKERIEIAKHHAEEARHFRESGQ